ncbi:MAG: YicC family protein [Deltaproteobacteria bacterium]|nr:MAG: YicC family protein [Deltaproteobacteria bacterium]
MLRSMTGFGRAEETNGEVDVVVEVKTLNHRFLEANVRLPGVFTLFELDVREVLKEYFQRGKVDVYVSVVPREKKWVTLRVNENVLHQYMEIGRRIGEEFGLEGEMTVRDVLSLRDVVEAEETRGEVEGLRDVVLSCVHRACREVVDMREREGKNLRKILRSILKKLRTLSSQLKTEAESNLDEKVERLRKRVKSLIQKLNLNEGELDESRVMMEVALLLDRFDVTEEIGRISSHLDQVERLLRTRRGPVGRKIDFLIQELNREFNTLGSKSQNSRISSLVVEGKALLEQMREQVQNVE